jgi:hypothetical protein
MLYEYLYEYKVGLPRANIVRVTFGMRSATNNQWWEPGVLFACENAGSGQ